MIGGLFSTLMLLLMALAAICAIAIWLAPFYLAWRFLRAARKSEGVVQIATSLLFAFFTFIAIAWLWLSVGRGFYYDAKVNRLCAIDGGVKVYETVKLPPERFDQEYFYENSTTDIWSDTLYVVGAGEAVYLQRYARQLIRRSDGKVLGEFIRYERRGGDALILRLIPAHGGNSFNCPKESRLQSTQLLVKAVFLKEIVK